jgi:hypothetical protein
VGVTLLPAAPPAPAVAAVVGAVVTPVGIIMPPGGGRVCPGGTVVGSEGVPGEVDTPFEAQAPSIATSNRDDVNLMARTSANRTLR